MARRNEAEYQAVAALASKKGGSESSAAAYAASAIIKCLENGNLELAVRICADHPDLKVSSTFCFEPSRESQNRYSLFRA